MRAIDVHDLLGAPLAFDTSRNYVTSPWFSTKTLAAIRGAIALYTFVTLLFILIWEAVVLNDASSYFSYFTELTYIGICSYYWASFTQTFAYARQLQHSSDKLPEYPLQKWPRILQLLHVMLQTTIITFPILVTIVYWALLASSSVFDTPFSAWSNLSLHVFNTIWSLFEMFGTNSPPPRWWMLPFMIIILALYLGVAYITFDTQGFYPYPFLDPTTQHTFLAAYIVGIALAACIVFSLAKTMMWTRMKFASGNKQVTVPKLTQEENVEISRMEEEGERLV
ncbi:hypothetical protein BDP27DRAFT_1314645 [Rhodocollybia butyracea]|uniref:FAR-17a/AIG1-like protein n=1 Tax=Rhodocollybia butyracea TaxID=206335 RepID=A0A9P5UE55_9AGAR|nr:hypothetical protein BDP27DRAFT_1314645 [Rhodocollybia butyracea]